MSDQNTPPHAQLVVSVTAHMQPGIGYAAAEIKGCRNCLIEAIAAHLLASPTFKELINKSVRLANERRAQKEN